MKINLNRKAVLCHCLRLLIVPSILELISYLEDISKNWRLWILCLFQVFSLYYFVTSEKINGHRHIDVMVLHNHFIHVSCWHIYLLWLLFNLTFSFLFKLNVDITFVIEWTKTNTNHKRRVYNSRKVDLAENENLFVNSRKWRCKVCVGHCLFSEARADYPSFLNTNSWKSKRGKPFPCVLPLILVISFWIQLLYMSVAWNSRCVSSI